MDENSYILSIVIPAFNEEKRLPQCIQHIREACNASSDLENRYEIIVCNNNSTDSTAALAKELGCSVVLEPINQISMARNKGASVASGQWLLFVDADSWPPPELIEDIVPLLSDKTCVGCGSTIKVIDGPHWFKYVWESKNWSMRTFKWCPGGFILCRRDAFHEVGGFSEEYFLFEEYDFVRRLQKLTASRGQEFLILHKHPFYTSGRRGTGKGFWWWVRFAFMLALFRNSTVRNKNFAKTYYEGDR